MRRVYEPLLMAPYIRGGVYVSKDGKRTYIINTISRGNDKVFLLVHERQLPYWYLRH